MYAGIRLGSPQPIAARSQRNSAKSKCLKLQVSLSDYPFASKVMVRRLILKESGFCGGQSPILCKLRDSSSSFPNFSVLCESTDRGREGLVSEIRVRFDRLDVPYTATESCLKKEFSRFGEIAEVKLVRDEASKRSKGYAFIQYTNQDDAFQALECMDQKHYNGRLISVELARPEQSSFGSCPRASGPPQEENLAKSDEATE